MQLLDRGFSVDERRRIILLPDGAGAGKTMEYITYGFDAHSSDQRNLRPLVALAGECARGEKCVEKGTRSGLACRQTGVSPLPVNQRLRWC
jgi:hypothetical protein